MAEKKSTRKIKAVVSRQVKRHVTPTGKVDLEALRKRNQPLAEVLDEFLIAKTARDNPDITAKDLGNVLDARDPQSRLGKALAKLERELSRAKKTSIKKHTKK